MKRERFCMDLTPRTVVRNLRKICTGKAVCHKRFAFIYSKLWEILLNKRERDLIPDFPALLCTLCYRLEKFLTVFEQNSLTGRFIRTDAEVQAFVEIKLKVEVPWVGRLRAKEKLQTAIEIRQTRNAIFLRPYKASCVAQI